MKYRDHEKEVRRLLSQHAASMQVKREELLACHRRIDFLESKLRQYKTALEEIHVGAESNAGRCLDCDTINSVACLALGVHNNAPQLA